MQESPSSRRVTARVGGAFGLIHFQISKQSRTEGNYTRIEHEANTQQGNTMPRSKKDVQVIKEVKRALDAALADGVISKDAFALIDSPGLQRRTQSSSWEDWLQAPEPKPEPEPEPEPASVDIPAPEIAPEPEPTQEAKCYEAVVVDACVPEVAEEISCTAAPPEETSEMEPAAMTVDQVEPSGHGRSVAEMVNGTADVQKTGADKKEKDKGFAFTTCFRCGIRQWLPTEKNKRRMRSGQRYRHDTMRCLRKDRWWQQRNGKLPLGLHTAETEPGDVQRKYGT
jgi:hypothetical protein